MRDSIRARIKRLIAYCEREIKLLDRGDEDAENRTIFLNLTVISIVAMLIVGVLMVYL